MLISLNVNSYNYNSIHMMIKYYETLFILILILGVIYLITENSSVKGWIGEHKIARKLRLYVKDGAVVLRNIYIPKEDEETTEIDILMIDKTGIYVIESKNYSGWIYGDRNQQYWTQTIKRKYKITRTQFYNPVLQNKNHIKWLKLLVEKELGYNINPISLVVFSNYCNLKNVIINDNVRVIYLKELLFELDKQDITLLSEEQISKIEQVLLPYTNVSKTIKKKHIQNIEEKGWNQKNTKSVNDKNANKSLEKELKLIKKDVKKELKAQKKIETKTEPNPIIEQSQESKDIKENISNSNMFKAVHTLTSDDEVCPICHSELALVSENTNKYFETKSYKCSRYPVCKYRTTIKKLIKDL